MNKFEKSFINFNQVNQISEINLMSDSDLSSQKPQKKSPNNNNKNKLSKKSLPLQSSQQIDDPTGLYQQNKKLRRKLKQLSMRLDEQLQKFAEQRLKHQAQKQHTTHNPQSQSLELQNAYKMIQRLQKSVHDFQSKQSYQVSLKRINDLDSIIRKKDKEIQDLKVQIKTLKKLGKEREKHVDQLLEAGKKQKNPMQQRDLINRMKVKMKKILQQNDMLRKKQLQKHQKLVLAQRKIVDLQQNDQPIGQQQSLLKQVQEWKNKHKQAMQRVERQNIYITKLNEKLSNQQHKKKQRKQMSQKGIRQVSKSVQELPQRLNKTPTANLIDHLPAKLLKLKRY